MSKPQTYFKDLSKRANDIISKEFPIENKVEWSGVTDSGVLLETNFSQKKDGSVSGTLTPSYKYKDWGATFLAELTTRKEFKAEVSLQDQIVEGLKTTISEQSKGGEVFTTAGAEYRNELVSVTATADYGKEAGSTVKGTAVVGRQGFALGVSGEYFLGLANNATSDLKEVNVTLGYSAVDMDITTFGRLKTLEDEDKTEVGASFFHRVNPVLSVGSEISFDVGNADTAKPKLTVAGQYLFSPDTLLKAKLDTDGKLGLSYQQLFNRSCKLTLGGSIDTTNPGGKGSSVFGFNLSLKQ